MKQTDKMGKKFREDIEFARRTEEAWTKIKAGKGIKMSVDEFIADMKKW